MSALRKLILATLFCGAYFYLVGCGAMQTAKPTGAPVCATATPGATRPALPPAGSTQFAALPPPVPSPWANATLSLPNAVETVAARTTSQPLTATADTFRQATATARVGPVLQRDYGSWSFIVMWYAPEQLTSEQLVANLWYGDRSVAGLLAYAQANQQLGRQIASEGGEAQVLITFRTYLSPEQFNKWAAEMGLQVTSTQLRVLYEQDFRLPTPFVCWDCSIRRPENMLRIRTQSGGLDPLPKTRLEAALAKQEQDARSLGYTLREVRGVYFASATVASRQLPTIANDPQVFLADVTFETVRRQLQARGLACAAETRMLYTPASGGSGLENSFSQLERLGLDNFAK